MRIRRQVSLLAVGLGVAALAWTWRGGPAAPTATASPPVAGGGPASPLAARGPWDRAPPTPAWPVRYDRFETLTTKDGLPSDHVTCVLAGPDELVVGTEKGLGIRREGRWTYVREANGLSHDVVTSLARDPVTGDLWVGTLRGLTRLSGGLPRVYHQLNSGLVNDIVYHVTVQGPLVWAATQAGASVLDTSTGAWALWDHRNSIMHEPWCYAVAHGPGRVWIGLWGGAIIERDLAAGAWREYRDPDGEMELDLFRDDGPIHEVTSFLCYDDALLWQGTYFGLSRFDGRAWDSYTAKDSGIPGDFVQHVVSRGRTVWIATDTGFGAFDGTTAVSYRREPDGRCRVTVTTPGRPVLTEFLPTSHAHDYVLWTQPGPHDVWLATGAGLSHGFAAAPSSPSPSPSTSTER